MIELLVWLAVLVIVVLVVWYLLQQMGLPEPAQRIITIVLVVIVAVIAIGILLQFAGIGGGFPRLRSP
jgi:hypothetical protein